MSIHKHATELLMARVLYVLLTLGPITLAACGGRTAVLHPDTRTVVLPDLSPSVRGNEESSICLAAFRRVVAYASATRGSVTVETIDGNPLQDSRTPIDTRFLVPAQLADEPVYATPILAQLEAGSVAQMTRVLAEPPKTPGTDVLSAIRLAARVFARQPLKAGPVDSLVLCSDMLNSVKPYDFYKLDLTANVISRVIRQLTAAGDLPILRNVRVHVVGGGQSTSGRISSIKARQVEAFFDAYFIAAGATVVSYAGTLPSFP